MRHAGAPLPAARRPLLPGAAALLLVLTVLATALLGATLPSASAQAAAARTHSGEPQPGDDFPQPPKSCDTGDPSNPTEFCHVVTAGPHAPTVVAWGDSHVWMYLPALKKAATQTHTNLVVIFAGGCPPVLPEPKTAEHSWTGCELHDSRAVQYLTGLARHHKPLRVVVGAYWDGYRTRYHQDQRDLAAGREPADSPWSQRMGQIAHDDTGRLFDRLGHLHIATDVLAQAATVPDDARHCPAGDDPYQCFLPRQVALYHEAGNRQWLREQTTGLTRPSRTIDPSPVYCGRQRCRPYVHGVPTFYDDLHLGASLTATMTSYFLPTFDAAHSR